MGSHLTSNRSGSSLMFTMAYMRQTDGPPFGSGPPTLKVRFTLSNGKVSMVPGSAEHASRISLTSCTCDHLPSVVCVAIHAVLLCGSRDASC